MLRVIGSAVRGLTSQLSTIGLTSSSVTKLCPVANIAHKRCFGIIASSNQSCFNRYTYQQNDLLKNYGLRNDILPSPFILTPIRTVIKFSMQKGKRKTVKTVTRRFYRLNWGIWIRPIAGSNKHIWKKKQSRLRRIRKHVFCNASQSMLLDKMVTSYWRRPHYYVDDPYTEYHEREEFPLTRKKPVPLP